MGIIFLNYLNNLHFPFTKRLIELLGIRTKIQTQTAGHLGHSVPQSSLPLLHRYAAWRPSLCVCIFGVCCGENFKGDQFSVLSVLHQYILLRLRQLTKHTHTHPLDNTLMCSAVNWNWKADILGCVFVIPDRSSSLDMPLNPHCSLWCLAIWPQAYKNNLVWCLGL